MKTNLNKSFLCCIFSALILILACILSSCVATKNQRERFLRENCTIASKSEIKDTTTRKETVKTDTFYKSVTGPIRYFASPCEKLCDSVGNLKPFKEISRKNGITQSIETFGNVLIQKCDGDSIAEINKQLTIELDHFRSEKSEIQIHDNCKLAHLTDKDIFWRMIGIRLSIILALYIFLRILKIYFQNVPWLAWLAKIII